ncbi:MAG: hypothetical protein K9M07_02680 [Simkaniaceae bacterium]|nr:hypothetical protein [Simkaniaceae bacterium]
MASRVDRQETTNHRILALILNANLKNQFIADKAVLLGREDPRILPFSEFIQEMIFKPGLLTHRLSSCIHKYCERLLDHPGHSNQIYAVFWKCFYSRIEGVKAKAITPKIKMDQAIAGLLCELNRTIQALFYERMALLLNTCYSITYEKYMALCHEYNAAVRVENGKVSIYIDYKAYSSIEAIAFIFNYCTIKIINVRGKPYFTFKIDSISEDLLRLLEGHGHPELKKLADTFNNTRKIQQHHETLKKNSSILITTLHSISVGLREEPRVRKMIPIAMKLYDAYISPSDTTDLPFFQPHVESREFRAAVATEYKVIKSDIDKTYEEVWKLYDKLAHRFTNHLPDCHEYYLSTVTCITKDYCEELFPEGRLPGDVYFRSLSLNNPPKRLLKNRTLSNTFIRSDSACSSKKPSIDAEPALTASDLTRSDSDDDDDSRSGSKISHLSIEDAAHTALETSDAEPKMMIDPKETRTSDLGTLIDGISHGFKFDWQRVHERVVLWEKDPLRALSDPKYSRIFDAKIRENIVKEHLFPRVLDSFIGTDFSMNIPNDDKNKTTFVLIGTLNGELSQFEYGFYKEKGQWILYHRWSRHNDKYKTLISLHERNPDLSPDLLSTSFSFSEDLISSPKLVILSEATTFAYNEHTRILTIIDGDNTIQLFKAKK